MVAGGVIADRFDRKRLLRANQLAVGMSISALAVLSLTGRITIWHSCAAAVLLGSLQALNQPARVGTIADLVDRRVLTLFGGSSWFWVAWALFLVVGVSSLGAVWPLAMTILQLASPGRYAAG